MEVKDNVRQRRTERIRNLQSGRDMPSLAPPMRAPASYTDDDPVKAAQGPLPLYVDGRLDDPEFVWNEKMQRWRDDEQLWGSKKDGGWSPSRTVIWVKLSICIVLFLGVAGLFRMKGPWADKGQAFIRSALTEDMDFQAVEAWYNDRFSGSPSLIPSFHAKKDEEARKAAASDKNFLQPFHGQVTSAYSSNRPWVEMLSSPEAPVYAIDTGLVVYAGNREGSGYTVIVQHAGGYKSLYGWLTPGKWAVNDWIKAGDLIGTVTAQGDTKGKLYFAMWQGEEAINPADAVALE